MVKKTLRSIFVLGIFISIIIGMHGYVQALTVTPTETILATTPTITPTDTTVTATASATSTNITSLPETGVYQYSLVFFAISLGVILFSLIF